MKQFLNALQLLFAFFLAVMLSACGTMAAPDTFAKKVATAYVTVQVVADSAGAALKAGKISASDATNVVNTSRAALASIDVAKSLYGTNPGAGEDKLQATVMILSALQAYLATQGAK